MATAAELRQKHKDEIQAFNAWLPAQKNDDGSFKEANTFLTELKNREAALAALGTMAAEAEDAEKATKAMEQSQGRIIAPETKGDAAAPEFKGSGDLDHATKSALRQHAAAFEALAKGDLSKGFPRFELPFGTKTIVALSDHYAQATRLQTTQSALYYNSVEDLFGTAQTGANNVEYFIQTTDTDNTAFVAEDTAVTDSAFSWTKTTDEVENVQTWIPISRNMVYDEPFMVSTIQGMLADRLAKKISQQLMYGTGTTPQLWGATVRTGFQTQAKGTDPAFDALLKAATLVAVTGDATPDAFVIHPTDWQNLVLTRTSDGIYILGNPGNPPANPTLWGLPVRVSSTVAAAAGTAAVGAFRTMAAAVYNGGLVVETATEHSTYFTENKVALSLRQRMSAVHYRPSAFCKVTGL